MKIKTMYIMPSLHFTSMKYFSVREAARRFGKSQTAVRKWVVKNKICTTNIDGHVTVPEWIIPLVQKGKEQYVDYFCATYNEYKLITLSNNHIMNQLTFAIWDEQDVLKILPTISLNQAVHIFKTRMEKYRIYNQTPRIIVTLKDKYIVMLMQYITDYFTCFCPKSNTWTRIELFKVNMESLWIKTSDEKIKIIKDNEDMIISELNGV